METLTEKIINEKVEAYRKALVDNLEASKTEIEARQAKIRAHKALQIAREDLLDLTSGTWEIQDLSNSTIE